MHTPKLAAALAATALLAAFPAHAITMVVGGLAGACFEMAKAGRFDSDARDTCTQALDAEPLNAHDRAGTFVNRGAMELRIKDYAAAHADFKAAMRVLPSLGEPYIGEGAYLISQQRYAEAEPQLSRGLQLGIEEPEKAYYFRGIARWGQDNYKGAYLDFKKASELKPGWDLPREQMAQFHVEEAPRP
jgi:tetratricopeptide (TPR) repeat protein